MRLPEINTIWNITEHNFNDIALQLFQYQVKNNPVYAQYVKLIDQHKVSVDHYSKIPFLPIAFFKTHKVVSGNFEANAIFESSSTTGTTTSKHYVKNLELYSNNTIRIFNQLIGRLDDFQLFGLLPNYLERKNSSLVHMVQNFMRVNQQEDAFYLYNHSDLYNALANVNSKKILLFGVSFALLDFAENYKLPDLELTIIETGGMKGRKQELTKEEVYRQLQNAFPKALIYSEYGMTELLSQAYATENARYKTPSWMKVISRADNDPFQNLHSEKGGALNIIDLANLHTCAFIASDDLGKVYQDGTFEVLGRLDYADIRGCSLMV